MKLVIVESPAKSKTISHYLGEEYIVEASVGHIRDLAIKGKGGLGVDVDNDFKPTYVENKDKKAIISNLKKRAKKCDEIILATDPDREGEAIAFHLAEVLKLPINETKRLEFHEITKNSIQNAILNPRTINMNLVHSQETRRIIDRILGFKLSTLIKNKINSQSAGRVQSVTLKLICDHEKEIKEFVPQEFYVIDGIIVKDDKDLKLELYRVNNEIIKPNSISNEEEANKILSLCNNNVIVKEININKKNISSKEAFRTSTLQQEAYSTYKLKTKETSLIAQSLYEGKEIGNEGLVGLITYMRTDSTKLSETFVESAKEYIIANYGENYYKGNAKPNKKIANSQDAHEAIRPTSLDRTPSLMKQYLSDKEYKIYKLIYNRTLASLMSDKILETEQIIFNSNSVDFKYDQNRVIFDGYNILKIDEKEKKENFIFHIDEIYDFKEIKKEQKFTNPPNRYNEGKIVKLMEDEGIGRPSTYSSTIQTLIARKYIISEKGVITPTEQGIKTATVLTKYFPDLMNTEYTAEMETNLDKVSVGEMSEIDVLNNFYKPFIEHFEEVKNLMYKDEPEYTGEICPECGSKLVKKYGRFGPFVACINYPNCHYVQKKEKDKPEEIGRICPDCGSPLVLRTNKKGDKFIGCSNFPKCRHIESLTIQEENKVGTECPKCHKGTLVKKWSRRGEFYGCSEYPNCDYTEKISKK